eukprot:jgi/Botrbrau1/17139/Bobra.0157s0036.1
MGALLISEGMCPAGAMTFDRLQRNYVHKVKLVTSIANFRLARHAKSAVHREAAVAAVTSNGLRQRSVSLGHGSFRLQASNLAEEISAQPDTDSGINPSVPRRRDVGPLPGILTRSPWEKLKGYVTWLMVMLVSVPIWLEWAFKLALFYITTGGKAFQPKDRSSIEFPDPFPGLLHEYVDVNNVRLHVVRAGPKRAGKKLMLFLHGFPEGWFSWKNQLEAFRDDYDVVSYDMRGYGKSSKPEGRDNYRMEFLVADVVAVVHALGYDTCVLVGHDWGSEIAWVTAALHPDMVEGLVITCLPHPTAFKRNTDAEQRKKSWYMRLFQAPVLGEALIKASDFKSVDDMIGPHLSPHELEGWKAHLAEPGVLTASVNYYRAMFDHGQGRAPSVQGTLGYERLGNGDLPMPVLMMYGDNDSALGLQLLKGTEEHVPNLELHVLSGTHFLHLVKPREVTETMRAFLAKNKL